MTESVVGYDPENPVCIVQRQSDGTFAYAHDGDVLELGVTLPGAVNKLDERGIFATHWLPKGEHSRMTAIPSGVARHHLTQDQLDDLRAIQHNAASGIQS